MVAEIETYHPGVTPYIEQADLWVWGHGLVAPPPGLLWGAARPAATQPGRNRSFLDATGYTGNPKCREGL